MSWQELWQKSWVRAIVLVFTAIWLVFTLSSFSRPRLETPAQTDPLLRWSSSFSDLAANSTGFWTGYYQLLGGIQGIESKQPLPPIPSAAWLATFWLIILVSAPLQIYWLRRLWVYPSPTQPQEDTAWSGWACYLTSDGISLACIILTMPVMRALSVAQQHLVLQWVFLGGSLVWFTLLRSRLNVPANARQLSQRLVLGVFGFCAILIGSFAISLVLHTLGLDGHSMNPVIAELASASPSLLLGWMITVVMLAPLREELWYRAVLSSSLGIVPAAIVFSLIHADPYVCLQLAWTGVVLGYAYRQGGLVSSWLAHGLWNLQAFWMVIEAVN